MFDGKHEPNGAVKKQSKRMKERENLVINYKEADMVQLLGPHASRGELNIVESAYARCIKPPKLECDHGCSTH